MATIYIYTEDLFFSGRAKNFLKKILGRDFGGPKSVLESLQRGLRKLDADFCLNCRFNGSIGVAAVLSGPKALRWAIGQKRRGLIKKLIAGPNVAVTPKDYGALILDPAIDQYIVPSQMSAQWWATFEPNFAKKLKLWPAGVEDLGENRDPGGLCLVYNKNAPKRLLEFITAALSRRSIAYYVVEYGKYSRADYLKNFSKTKFAIFLSELESQGLAMQEAWMANIPTLIWNRGYFIYQDKRWDYPLVSAPLYSPECGVFFKDEKDFPAALSDLLNRYAAFNPRLYCLSNLTDEMCAKKYLEVANYGL